MMTNREYESRDTNQTRTEKSSSNFFLGALIGGVAGAVAALLLAPKSGKELRDTVSNQAGSIMGKSTEMRENVINKSNELVSKTSSLSQGIVLKSSELLNKVKGNATNRDEGEEKSDSTYISLHQPKETTNSKKSIETGNIDSSEIRKKLEEAEKAFEEEESKVKL